MELTDCVIVDVKDSRFGFPFVFSLVGTQIFAIKVPNQSGCEDRNCKLVVAVGD